MRRVILTRFAWTLVILLGVSFIAFMLMRALPGDFAIAAAGSQSVAPEVLDAIRRDLGLDRPLLEQYFHWLGHALTGDLGRSFVTKQPVLGELPGRFIVTFQLTLIAAIIAMTMGIATGLASARLRGRTDWIVRIYNGLILAVPNFVVATLIVLLAGLYFPADSRFSATRPS